MCFLQGARKAPSENEGGLGDQHIEELEGTLAITSCPPMNMKKETSPTEARSRPRSQTSSIELGLKSGLPPQCPLLPDSGKDRVQDDADSDAAPKGPTQGFTVEEMRPEVGHGEQE